MNQKHVNNHKADVEFLNKVIDTFNVDEFTGDVDDFKKAFDLFKKLKLRFLER